MTALRLLSAGAGPSPTIAALDLAVERAWFALREAEDAFAMVELGNLDTLFAAQAAWAAAIVEHERAKLAHAEAVKRSQGRTGLVLVMGEKQ